jgi:hypothetical protein
MVPVPIKDYWKDEGNVIEDGVSDDNISEKIDKITIKSVELNKIHCIENNKNDNNKIDEVIN